MPVIENLSLANTFGEWVNITNDAVDAINTLYFDNFNKPTGTLYLSEPTTGLVVANNSLFQGLVQVGTSGSIVSYGLIEGKDSLVLSNTSSNKVVLTANGIVELIGPNASLKVSNNAIIYGRLNVDNIVANTITVKNFNNDFLNAAFSQANSAASFANGAFTKANTTNDLAYLIYSYANTSYTQANNAASFANGAFTRANTTNDLAYIIYSYANTSYTQANNAASFANGAFSRANSAASFANGAFTTANNAFNVANAAFFQANNAFNVTNVVFGVANSAASFANGAFVSANSAASFANGAFNAANSAASFANGAFTKANTTNDLAYIVYAYANTGYAQANSAASFANGVFTTANAALPKSGGTLTGDITGANATFQNISAQGNFTINGVTVYNSDVFTLNSGAATNQNGIFSNYRPSGSSNAAIRWNESTLSWGIRDVNNTDTSTAYANVVTSNTTSSTTRSGIVQLTDSISSTSTTTAATPNSVKTSYDLAQGSFNLANTLVYTSGAFDRANSAYAQANSAASFANGAFTTANSAASFANGAFVTANSAASFANGAFTFANTRYSASGGTISGDVSVTGNLTVNGTATYIYSKVVDINDSLIHLANNNTSSDTVDIGFYGTYNTGGFNRYTGLFRKAADKYYLVQALTTDPSQNTVTFNNLNRSTLDANFTGGTVSGLSSAIPVADGGTGTTTSTGTGSVVLHTGPELISPSMSGMPTAPTAAAGNNSTMVATTAFVQTAGTNVIVAPFLQANNSFNVANASFNQANNSFNVANAAFIQANNSFNVTNVAFTAANSATSLIRGFGFYTQNGITANTGPDGVRSSNNAFIGLASSGVSVGTYANANTISVVTYDTYGRATYAANVRVVITSSQISDLSATITPPFAQANNSFAQANNSFNVANLAYTAANVAFGRVSVTANTGDLIANGINTAVVGNVVIGLATTTVAAGTYGGTSQIPVITIDTKGRATYAANVTFSGGATITDDITTDATRYPLFASSTSGTLSTAYTSSSDLTYNPSTGTLSAVIFTSLSDRSVKDNIQIVTGALDTIKQLEGVSFNWKENGNKSYGVIAQDIEQVLPDMVQTNDAGLKTVDYQALSAFLIESIKELKTEIDTLKEKLYNK